MRDRVPARSRRLVSRAQRRLSEIYHLDVSVRASDCLMSAQQARELLPEPSPRSGLLALEEGDELWLGLYLDPRDADDPHTIAEETSHFVCLAWHADQQRPVSALILEFQSEVDRYILARLQGHERMAHFERFRWDGWMSSSIRSRYELAHHAGWRYCRALEQRYPARQHTPELLDELRDFYRASPAEKLSRFARI